MYSILRTLFMHLDSTFTVHIAVILYKALMVGRYQ
jgi:hypothetical protein